MSSSSLSYRGNGAVLGWERAPKQLLPTLSRHGPSQAWGMTLVCGQDILESAGRWSGVAVHRNDRGMWVKVDKVRADTPASSAGLQINDFVQRINGRLVFHMKPEEVERLIKTSGNTLYLDIER